MNLWKSYGLLFDRTVQSAPFIVYKESPFRLNPTADECTVMTPVEANTGAIGFFEDNQSPDIISLISYEGYTTGSDNKSVRLSDVSVFKVNLQSVISNGPRLSSPDLDYSDEDSSVDISELTFNRSQTWTAYMGYFANSLAFFF